MRMSTILNELFTIYKIEKWNNRRDCWEYYSGYVNYNFARRNYSYLLKNTKGIYRLIKVIEINER